jgi:hypothetical protein
MRAMTYRGSKRVRVEGKPLPSIEQPGMRSHPSRVRRLVVPARTLLSATFIPRGQTWKRWPT